MQNLEPTCIQSPGSRFAQPRYAQLRHVDYIEYGSQKSFGSTFGDVGCVCGPDGQSATSSEQQTVTFCGRLAPQAPKIRHDPGIAEICRL